MNTDEFRKLALKLSGASEASHQGHPDFRVGGRIFATLGYPDSGWAMVKLNPPMQARLIQGNPEVYFPAKGAWGARGSTLIKLDQAGREELEDALAAAWSRIAAPAAKLREPKRVVVPWGE